MSAHGPLAARVRRAVTRRVPGRLLVLAAIALAVPTFAEAQGRAADPGRGGAPQTARASAPIDLTGYWVSVVTQDWRWRMITPPKGDYASIPITLEAKKVGDGW